MDTNPSEMSADEFAHALENRRAARDLCLDAAMRGNPVCGGMFAMEAMARSAIPGGDFLVDHADFNNDAFDEDDIRPF